MALVLADRVRDTTTTTGTGTVTLSGTAPTGYQTFGATIGNGNTTYYTINAGSQWEVGIGTYSSTGPTLARTTVLASSNSGSLVDFSTGTKDVFVTYPAEEAVYQDGSTIKAGTAILGVTNGGTGTNTAFTSGSVVFAGASGVYSQDNANLFWDNTNDRLGIGTSSPGAALQINKASGAADLRLSVAGTLYSNIYASSSDANIFSITAIPLILGTNNTERMRIDSSGNVGIGTTSPGQKLDVLGSNGTGFAGISARNNNGNVGIGGIEFGSDATYSKAAIGLVRQNANGQGALVFYNASSTGAANWSTADERMRIDSSGNVGVGTSAPVVRFEVAGSVGTTFSPNIYNTVLSGTDSATSGNAGSGIAFRGYYTGTSYADFAFVSGIKENTTDGNYAGALLFGTRPNGSGGGSMERMRIDSSGNVGIGTAAPATTLDVATGFIQLSSGATARSKLFADASVSTLTAEGARSLVFATNGAERARIDSSGNASIGTTAGLARLRVAAAGAVNAPVLGNVTNYPAFLSNNDPSYGLGIGTSAGDGRVWLQAQRSDSATAYNITLNEAGGNVAIGNSTAAPKFSVTLGTGFAWGGGWNTAAAVFGGNGAGSGSGSGGLGITYDDTDGGTIGPVVPGVAWKQLRLFSDKLVFYTNGATERMRISNNGSVAIGGTGADASLHIQQAYGGYDRLTQISPNTASKNGFNIMSARNSSNADLWWSWGVRNDNVWVLQEGVNYSLNGGLGFYYDSGGQAYKSGGGTWAASSDARIKTNIAPISDAASRIMALKPSSFDYRVPEAHPGRVTDRGFIAQDFEEVYPHSVSESAMVADAEKDLIAEGSKIKAISLNTDFFADLVALVQEQHETINDLRARVAQLEGN
jgi:hypothetical protein